MCPKGLGIHGVCIHVTHAIGGSNVKTLHFISSNRSVIRPRIFNLTYQADLPSIKYLVTCDIRPPVLTHSGVAKMQTSSTILFLKYTDKQVLESTVEDLCFHGNNCQ